MSIKSVIMFILLSTISVDEMFAQEEIERHNFGGTFGVGFVDGREYWNVMQQYWSSRGYQISKIGTLVNVEGGVEFRVINQLYLNPRIRWLFGLTQRTVSYGSVTESKGYEASSLFLPGLSVKYFVRLVGSHFVFLNAFGSWIKPFSGQKELYFGSNGIEKGFGLGYEHVSDRTSLGVKLGYTTIPVKVQATPRDFGGIEWTVSFFF